MTQIKPIYSLTELYNMLLNHKYPKKVLVVLDLDLTLIKEKEDQTDELIEPEVSKKLFKHMRDNNIWFLFLTARFGTVVCNAKKRNLTEMTENIRETLFPVFRELGLDVSEFDKENDECIPIRSDAGRTVGVIYRGILFGANKGHIIKQFRKMTDADKTHPYTIFVDDIEEYLTGAIKHVPRITALQRFIKN